MVKKTQRMYNKSQKKKDWEHYIKHTKESRKALRSAWWNYISKILPIGPSEYNTKPFWKYVKTTRQENIAVAPMQKDG